MLQEDCDGGSGTDNKMTVAEIMDQLDKTDNAKTQATCFLNGFLT